MPAYLNPFNTGVLGGRVSLGSIKLALAKLEGGPLRSAAVYLHGCGGFGMSGRTNARLLAEAGFVVFAPDSFARPKRIKTCDGKRKIGIGPKGSYSHVISMRLRELETALDRMSRLEWIDRDRLVLFGHSQGSNAAAVYPGNDFRGRIMTGTRCSRGYKAPPAEPALAVYSAKDPWFRERPVRCKDHMDGTALQVMELKGRAHVTVRVPQARNRILRFLKDLRR